MEIDKSAGTGFDRLQIAAQCGRYEAVPPNSDHTSGWGWGFTRLNRDSTG